MIPSGAFESGCPRNAIGFTQERIKQSAFIEGSGLEFVPSRSHTRLQARHNHYRSAVCTVSYFKHSVTVPVEKCQRFPTIDVCIFFIRGIRNDRGQFSTRIQGKSDHEALEKERALALAENIGMKKHISSVGLFIYQRCLDIQRLYPDAPANTYDSIAVQL